MIQVSPSFEHGTLTFVLSGHCFVWNQQRQCGRFAVEVRCKLPGDDHNAVIPDLAYFESANDLPAGSLPVPRLPDLAVEIQSPDDSPAKLRRKAAYDLANGTRMVWLFFTEQPGVEVHRPGAAVRVLTLDDTLDGGDVLPGFALPLRVIFAGRHSANPPDML